MFISNNV